MRRTHPLPNPAHTPAYLSGVRKLVALFCILASAAGSVSAQSFQALAYLRDKAGTPYQVGQPQLFLGTRSLLRRAKFGIAVQERDLPVSPVYVGQLRALGLQVDKASKWLNAVSITGDSATVIQALAQPYVVQTAQLAIYRSGPCRQERYGANTAGFDSVSYGEGYNQSHMLGIDSMHAAGYMGRGVLVAVMDAGYINVQRHVAFAHIRDSGRFADLHDFAYGQGEEVFNSNYHGGGVLSCIGGHYPGHFIGGAYRADYALYITEASGERPIEMFNWVVAAERADSLGADLISTSLGYTFFDKDWLSYSPAQADGHTSFMTRAVDIAAETGMLCVTSAGNEGGNPAWNSKISIPADAQKGLTVGAVAPDSTIAGFSSRGLGGSPYTKPDVVAQGVACIIYDPNNPTGVVAGAGTSFACPLVSGLLAGMMEQFPQVSPAGWLQALHETASRRDAPDTTYGYGIPNYRRLAAYLSRDTSAPLQPALLLYPNPQARGHSFTLQIGRQPNVGQVELVNILGQQIRSYDSPQGRQGSYVFSLEGVGAGTYLVRIHTSVGLMQLKLVVV